MSRTYVSHCESQDARAEVAGGCDFYTPNASTLPESYILQ